MGAEADAGGITQPGVESGIHRFLAAFEEPVGLIRVAGVLLGRNGAIDDLLENLLRLAPLRKHPPDDARADGFEVEHLAILQPLQPLLELRGEFQ